MFLVRAAALVAGLILLGVLFKSHGGWLLLFSIPGGVAIVWWIARLEGVAFGQWQDYALGGLIGVGVVFLIASLLAGVSPLWAFLNGIGRGVEAGAGLGLIAYALIRRGPLPTGGGPTE